MFEIEPQEYQIAVERARADVQRARAQQIYNDCERDASLNGGLGHAAMDALMEDCLREARYIAGLEIFDSLRHICY